MDIMNLLNLLKFLKQNSNKKWIKPFFLYNEYMKKYTYISLFSSAGVGCYGFKKAGFECVATNELITKRLEIQKLNNKCKSPMGYIAGDIKTDVTKALIMDEIRKNDNSNIDVVIATPPCQGMSTANYKKNNELPRNSLVIESLKMILKIRPRYFILENVKSFLKTICQDDDGEYKTIKEVIYNNLNEYYNIHTDVINFSR